MMYKSLSAQELLGCRVLRPPVGFLRRFGKCIIFEPVMILLLE